MTIQLLTLVALWCGNPVTHNVYDSGPNITIADVNQCRTKILYCLENDPVIEPIEQTANRCFKKVPYPGKDN